LFAGGEPVRKAINDDPMVQVGVLATLALLVGFVLVTQMGHNASSSSTDTSTSAASVAPGAAATTPSDPTVPPHRWTSDQSHNFDAGGWVAR
jgi:hypothetical protein